MTKAETPAGVGAAAVLVAGVLIVGLQELGPLSRHMAIHIGLMNVAAPLAAMFCAQRASAAPARAARLWLVAALQLALLWGWHAPSVQRQVMGIPGGQFLMHASLFGAAFLFWRALLGLPSPARWQAIPVLLVTAKLACLFAALLVFSPRLLFDLPPHAGPPTSGGALTPLEDQQLAGLIMIAACPLSYVVAALIFAAQALGNLEERSPTRDPGFSAEVSDVVTSSRVIPGPERSEGARNL